MTASAAIALNKAFFKEKLEGEKVSLIERIEKYEQEIKEAHNSTSIDDVASDYESRAKIKGLKALDERRLIGINAALVRLDNNEYGVCQTCFEDINPKRLESNPLAANCIECQGKIDAKDKHFR